MTGAPTITVQQDQVAHGKYALQVHYPDMAAQSYAFLIAPHLPEAVKGHLFGRAYVKIAPGLPPSHTVMVLAGQAELSQLAADAKRIGKVPTLIGIEHESAGVANELAEHSCAAQIPAFIL